MENMTSEKTYAQLFRAFSKLVKRIPYSGWEQFITKSKIIQVKQKGIFLEANQLSTHSYFIISGLVMSYFERSKKRYVKWIRGENDYAFSADIFRHDVDKDSLIMGESLVALEDTVAISVSHEDLKWLCIDFPRINMAISRYYMDYSIMYRRLEANDIHDPIGKYDNIQRAMDFDLERVPDVYLASYLGISLKALEKVKEYRRSLK